MSAVYMCETLLYRDRVSPNEVQGFSLRDDSLGVIDRGALFELYNRTITDKSKAPDPLKLSSGVAFSGFYGPDRWHGSAKMDREWRGDDYVLSGKASIVVCTSKVVLDNVTKSIAERLVDDVPYNIETLSANHIFFHEWHHLVKAVNSFSDAVGCELSCKLSDCIRDGFNIPTRSCTRLYNTDEDECNNFADAEIEKILHRHTKPIYLIPADKYVYFP